MPTGEHLARCLNCGKTWIVGDCIPAFCSDSCSKAHTAWWARLQEMMDEDNRRIKENNEAGRV